MLNFKILSIRPCPLVHYPVLILLGLLCFLAVPARGTVTSLAWWHLGENDPGAADGVTAFATTNREDAYRLTQTGGWTN